MPTAYDSYDDIDPRRPIFVATGNTHLYHRESDNDRYRNSCSNDLGTVIRWAHNHSANHTNIRLGVCVYPENRTISRVEVITLGLAEVATLIPPTENLGRTCSVGVLLLDTFRRFPQYDPENSENTMPTLRNELTTAPASTLAPASLDATRRMVTVNIKREAGVLWLMLDAKPLHDMLDAIGVVTERLGSLSVYKDQPRSDYEVLRGTKLMPRLFLKQEYPVRIRLSSVLDGDVPPSFAKLRQIAESSQEVVRNILGHYQPIDISISVQKKLVGEG